MFAQYSPLFTSGLLSDSSSPSSSRSPSPQPKARKPAHESLPLSATFSVYSGEGSENALFLTFKPSRRHIQEGHSFLSLDLAESHRSMSLRRKDTVTTTYGRSAPTSPVSSAPALPGRTSFAPFCAPSDASNTVSPVRGSSPVLRRASRETMRLPSPKPAPSTNLPEVPRARQRPSLSITLSAYPQAGSSFTPLHHRPTMSEPSILSPPLDSSPILSPDANQSYFFFSPTLSAPPTPPLTGTSDFSVAPEPRSARPTITSLKTSPSFRSTASTGTRQRNRSAALAALEGRSASRRHFSIRRPRNFMSMSDDEDEEDDPIAVEKRLLSVLDEEEDVVIPPAVRATVKNDGKQSSRRDNKRATTVPEGRRSRRGTIDSLLSPLTNFIDFRDDEPASRRSWRSFIEFSA